MDLKGNRQVVHVKRLKKSFNPELAKPQKANGNSQDVKLDHTH